METFLIYIFAFYNNYIINTRSETYGDHVYQFFKNFSHYIIHYK